MRARFGLGAIELVDPTEKDDDGGVPPNMPSFAEQIRSISILRQVLHVLDDAPPRVFQELRSLHRTICHRRAQNSRQITVASFFFFSSV